jgi:hypothetical protein
MRNGSWKLISTVFALIVGLAVMGCEVEDDSDASDTTGGDTGGGGDSTLPGTEDCDNSADDDGDGDVDCDDSDCADEPACVVVNCAENGSCNPDCVDAGTNLPTDPDCNQCTPETSDESCQNPSCSCDYWGFVCEAEKKCSDVPCECDPDCIDLEQGLFEACNSDGHCDTWCKTDVDPDCSGDPDNGKHCGGGGSCDQKAFFCDAAFSGNGKCDDDPDCDDTTGFPCELDGTYCDPKCDADPDCNGS